jgi:hypothetical protein
MGNIIIYSIKVGKVWEIVAGWEKALWEVGIIDKFVYLRQDLIFLLPILRKHCASPNWQLFTLYFGKKISYIIVNLFYVMYTIQLIIIYRKLLIL